MIWLLTQFGAWVWDAMRPARWCFTPCMKPGPEAVSFWFRRICPATREWIMDILRPVRWLFGGGIEPKEPGTDGLRTLVFFATLLTSQAAALILVVQGDNELGRTGYLIYIAFALFLLAGIVIVVLRNFTTANDQRTSVYNRATIWFARWALVYGIVLAIGLPLLGKYGRIPGQTTKLDYTKTFVQCLPLQFGATDKLQGSDHIDPAIDEWITGLSKGLDPGPDSDKVLVIAEQDGSFTENYRRFPAWAMFAGNVVAQGGQAYLVRKPLVKDGGQFTVKLRLLPDEQSDIQTHVIDIVDPEKDDFLVLFLIVGKRKEKLPLPPPDPAAYGFQLKVGQTQ